MFRTAGVSINIDCLKRNWSRFTIKEKYGYFESAISNHDDNAIKFIIQNYESDFIWNNSKNKNEDLVLAHTCFILEHVLIGRDEFINYLEKCEYKFDKFLYRFKDCFFFKTLDDVDSIDFARNKVEVLSSEENMRGTPLIEVLLQYYDLNDSTDALLKKVMGKDIHGMLDRNFSDSAKYLFDFMNKRVYKSNMKLEYDPQVDFQFGHEKKTALMIAVEHNDLVIASKLIDRGANPNIKDANGNTALIISCDKVFDQLTDFLINHNSDLTIKNNEGKTALDFALESRMHGVIDLVLNKMIKDGMITDPYLIELGQVSASYHLFFHAIWKNEPYFLRYILSKKNTKTLSSIMKVFLKTNTSFLMHLLFL